MHREMGQMMEKDPILIGAFPGERFISDHDIAEKGRGAAGFCSRKRQHIGRLVDAAPIAIELSDRLIVGQNDAHFAARR